MGWPAGTSMDSQDTLSFSVLSGVRSMNEVFPLERAPEAYESNDEWQSDDFERSLQQDISDQPRRQISLKYAETRSPLPKVLQQIYG